MLSPNFASDQRAFLGTLDSGVYATSNGGGSWTTSSTDMTDLNVRDLAVSPAFASDQTIYTATDGGGIFKSTSGGGNWSAINSGLPYPYINRLALSPNYTSDGTLYAAFGDVYMSTDLWGDLDHRGDLPPGMADMCWRWP